MFFVGVSERVCACLSVLHNEWSAARVFRTLAVPVLHPQLLHVDVAGGGVVGAGLQNRPVAPEEHQTGESAVGSLLIIQPQRGRVTEGDALIVIGQLWTPAPPTFPIRR